MADLAPGVEFAGCRIEAVAARGGMGVVYRATEVALGRPVAVKLMASDQAADPAFRERFERESRLTAGLDHPNVIPVYGAGEEGGRLFIVMRWVRGTDLHALLREEGRLEAQRAAGLVTQVAAALDAAHETGLVHRDVKPANVLIAGEHDREHVYLTDFGVTRDVDAETRLTESGDWIGTLDFMAPEHLEGRRTDARTDVYALGCVLFTALTGAPPFRRPTLPATILAHLNDPAPRPSQAAEVPAALDDVVARALAKHPDERFRSAGDLARAAQAAAEGVVVPSSETSVARGPAAPDAPADRAPTIVVPGGPVAAGAPQAPERPTTHATRLDPRPAAGDARRRPRARSRLATIALVLGVTAAAAATVVILDDKATTRAGPLTDADVRRVADAFATAYGKEDTRGLERVLAPGVQRVSTGDEQRGRGAVLREYDEQFAASRVTGYEFSDLDVSGGAVGRASGRYEVSRAGRAPITGRVVLGVARVRGTPKVRLIAAEPAV